jgi:hypothetical protein
MAPAVKMAWTARFVQPGFYGVQLCAFVNPFSGVSGALLVVSTHGGSNTCDVPLQNAAAGPHSVNKRSMISDVSS